MIPLLCAASIAVTGLVLRRARRATARLRVGRRLTPDVVPSNPRPTLRWCGPSPSWFRAALERAGFDHARPDDLWRYQITGALLVTVAVGMVLGPAVAVLALGTTLVGPCIGLWTLRDRGERRVEAALPTVLETVAGSMRSGSSMLQALGAAGDVMPGVLGVELAAVVACTERGSPLAAELDRWVERRPIPGLRLTVAALALGAHTGGPQARALDAVATTLRDREAVRREVTALASQARASALVMTVIPVGFAALASLLDPRVAHVLTATPIGLACLGAGLVLDAAAGVWMARITGALG